MFGNVYKGRKVLVTGNTGFKGSWLVLWLLNLGAKVVGYSSNIPTRPNHHEILNLDFETAWGDTRNLEKLQKTFETFQPEIIFHLAAQPLVLKSYRDPVETFETNVIGTVNVLEACRYIDSVRAIVNITSDKCYENKEWVWGYRENDPVAGRDPYSASKGCAELVIASYRMSFFPIGEYKQNHHTLVSSVRAGNVIGGGDWAEDRLVPDIMRAASKNRKTIIRNLHAIRPWQHVLEPLSGYLLLGQRLLEDKKEFSGSWNFGPNYNQHIQVLEVVQEMQKHWDRIDFQPTEDEKNLHEATWLKLDCSKAHTKLGWKPVLNSSTTFATTALWYREFYESGRVLSQEQLDKYTKDIS
ncbi:MAG: CDP-glucose 4,6-dehydratase [Phycisphaerales bacterium]|jgi:CDP-glucose 4,6-dehydratase